MYHISVTHTVSIGVTISVTHTLSIDVKISVTYTVSIGVIISFTHTVSIRVTIFNICSANFCHTYSQCVLHILLLLCCVVHCQLLIMLLYV